MEDSDFLEQEILKRIDEMENQKYEFPKKFSVKDYIITGIVVLAAKAPARCAALPAAAIITPKPFARAFTAKSLACTGVRCAEKMWHS